ncbi:hypothetical protein D9M70_544040 [compost metagenome]
MTRHASGGEQLATVFDLFVSHAFRQRATVELGGDEGGHVMHALVAQHIAPRRHRSHAAVQDGGFDGGRLATPAPGRVGQVGEAVGALGVRAMADGAVGGEQALTHFHGLRVLGYIFNWHGGIFGEDGAIFLLGQCLFMLPLLGSSPAIVTRQQSFPVSQSGVEREVAGREDDGADEQQEPPFW